MKNLFLFLCSFALCHAAIATPTEPGIFAVFTTNHGEFTSELFYEQAPMTVANFVGLAEGSLPHLDPQTGTLATRPFFDGLTFHRVIENFMIQGGSPNGLGTDGPGYRFGNEFDTSLIHDTAGILSMANAGPDTNGSQFFVTAAPTSHLDFQHSVFGKVSEGLNIVLAISETETHESTDSPIDPVIIESVEIVRNGPAAVAFDVNAQGLPKLTAISPQITVDEAIKLHFPRHTSRKEILFWSDDLQTWERQNLQFQQFSAPDEPLDVSSIAAGKDRQFYRLITVEHAHADHVPTTVLGKRLTLQATSHAYTFILNIVHDREDFPYPPDPELAESLGTGSFNGDATDWLDYFYLQEPVSGVINFVLGGLPKIRAYLQFTTETSGTFTGIVNPSQGNPWGLFGTFTLEDLD